MCLDPADAIEPAEILDFIAGWLASDPPALTHHCCTTSVTLSAVRASFART
jgi:hypothetical protein